jgi:hypothetical protein
MHVESGTPPAEEASPALAHARRRALCASGRWDGTRVRDGARPASPAPPSSLPPESPPPAARPIPPARRAIRGHGSGTSAAVTGKANIHVDTGVMNPLAMSGGGYMRQHANHRGGTFSCLDRHHDLRNL